MTVQNPAIFLQAGSHPAEDVRRFVASAFPFTGVYGISDLAVTEKSGTPNMSVDVAGGRALIPGNEATYQGTYFVENRGTENLVISAADATNPRIDLIVARVQDAAYSGATNAWSLAVVTGTPAASPTAPDAPENSIVLARVAVAASASSITDANITDYRYITAGQTLATARGGMVYCRSDNRPASPYRGMAIFETDTGNVLVYYGATTGWQKPWNQPWGAIYYAQRTSDIAGIGTGGFDVTTSTAPFTAVANRRYKITTSGRVGNNSSSANVFVSIRDGSSDLKVNSIAMETGGAGFQDHYEFSIVNSASLTAGTRDYKTRITTSAGTVSLLAGSSYPCFMAVEDLGPLPSTNAPSD
jgi:hypothetical protein